METVLNQSQNRSLLSLNSVMLGLIFLFPVLAVSVKSWTSAFHLFLFVSSVAWLFRSQHITKEKITTWEKLFILLLLLSFFWYLFSEYINGWQSVKSHWPLIDFRYVLIIPILLAFKNLKDINQWLIKGFILGCISAAVFTLYQLLIINAAPPMGAYHHLFLGPATAAMSLIIFYSKPQSYEQKMWCYLAYVGILCGIMTLVLSTARSGFLATLLLLAIFPLLTGKLIIKRVLGFLFMLLIVTVAIYSISKSVQLEVDSTIKSFQSHIQQLSLSKEKYYRSNLDNITIRFEMWRAALDISKENLLFGVGRSGYPNLLHSMIENGEVHPQLAIIDQPHNAYLYHFVTRGVIGLILFLSILLIPLVIFFRYWKKAQPEAVLGVVWVLFFSLVSLTQSSVFARGHYLSFFLVILAILLASCMNAANTSQHSER